MISQYTINVNNKSLNEVKTDNESIVINLAIQQIFDKINNNGWEIKTNETLDGFNHEISINDSYFKMQTDQIFNNIDNSSMKNFIQSKLIKFYYKEEEKNIREEIKQKFINTGMILVEKYLSFLSEIDGITIMKDNELINFKENKEEKTNKIKP